MGVGRAAAVHTITTALPACLSFSLLSVCLLESHTYTPCSGLLLLGHLVLHLGLLQLPRTLHDADIKRHAPHEMLLAAYTSAH